MTHLGTLVLNDHHMGVVAVDSLKSHTFHIYHFARIDSQQQIHKQAHCIFENARETNSQPSCPHGCLGPMFPHGTPKLFTPHVQSICKSSAMVILCCRPILFTEHLLESISSLVHVLPLAGIHSIAGPSFGTLYLVMVEILPSRLSFTVNWKLSFSSLFTFLSIFCYPSSTCTSEL